MRSIDSLCLAPRDRRAIREATRELRARFPVARVVLFGSKARGEDDQESDIDLLVLVHERLSWQERMALTEALFPIQLRHEVVLSTLVVSLEEWERGVFQALPIRAEIEAQGAAA